MTNIKIALTPPLNGKVPGKGRGLLRFLKAECMAIDDEIVDKSRAKPAIMGHSMDVLSAAIRDRGRAVGKQPANDTMPQTMSATPEGRAQVAQ
jgi:hypothetical protein